MLIRLSERLTQYEDESLKAIIKHYNGKLINVSTPDIPVNFGTDVLEGWDAQICVIDVPTLDGLDHIFKLMDNSIYHLTRCYFYSEVEYAIDIFDDEWESDLDYERKLYNIQRLNLQDLCPHKEEVETSRYLHKSTGTDLYPKIYTCVHCRKELFYEIPIS